ncbi:fimbria/pilus periplasmic chaperone [Cupriavidus pauculus]|uniref:fimbria/pilus periplasmic chaperone n=1 Tax=Cupriavidus pauculus TaxID=82633 RepID=UPI0027E44A7D|nr:fimbria/pilus periplasmic chaperone [Cupriavidus pauculus]
MPFHAGSALFRLAPKKGQTLRIIRPQQPLPRDRESLFRLNVLDVLPMASCSADKQNSLEFVFRSASSCCSAPNQWLIVETTGAADIQRSTEYQ